VIDLPTSHVTTFWTWLEGRVPDEKEFSKYLATLGEWWNSEFKAAVGQGDYALRKAVCALSNTRGGEVFLGVSNSRELVGTRLTEQGISQLLRQDGAQPGVWYVVDLTFVVRRLMPVALSSVGEFLYALEISPPGLPVFLKEETKELSLYLRQGESSVKADAFKALEWNRKLTREEILRTCYMELKTLSRTVGEMSVGLSVGLGLSLPYFSSRLEDGTFYRLLTDEDTMFLLGQSKGSGYQGGVLQDLFETRHQLQQILERGMHTRTQYDESRTILGNASETLSRRVESFRNYLLRQGIAVD